MIPGIGDAPVEEWSKAHQISLVHDLVQSGDPALKIQVSVLEHRLTSENLHQWEQLGTQAKALLPVLDEFVHDWNVSLAYPNNVLPA